MKYPKRGRKRHVASRNLYVMIINIGKRGERERRRT